MNETDSPRSDGSPLSPIQKAYLMILDDARVGSPVSGYRSGLVRALTILEHCDPDAPAGMAELDPLTSYGRPGDVIQ